MAALFMAMRVELGLGGLLTWTSLLSCCAHVYIPQGRQYIDILGVLSFLLYAPPLRPRGIFFNATCVRYGSSPDLFCWEERPM